MAERKYMERALALAALAKGRTAPNPMVGAVLVKDGVIVGEGYHRRAGAAHAEIEALAAAGAAARGASLYVTLEPCSHYGRTGPCALALIEAGVARVVAAMEDPNPLVSGRGFALLRQAGIEVEVGLCAAEARALNAVFLTYIQKGRPFFALKYAMSLDGKIATYTGSSQWITSPYARSYVHELRDTYGAILVGVGTVLADNPALTTRLPNGQGRDPVRLVLDSCARTPPSAQVLTNPATQVPTYILTTQQAPSERRSALAATPHGQVVVLDSGPDGKVDLFAVAEFLKAQGITSVLVEGGARVNAALCQAGLVDKVYAFLGAKLIGGAQAPGPIGGQGIAEIARALPLTITEVRRLGPDLLIEACPKNPGVVK